MKNEETYTEYPSTNSEFFVARIMDPPAGGAVEYGLFQQALSSIHKIDAFVVSLPATGYKLFAKNYILFRDKPTKT